MSTTDGATKLLVDTSVFARLGFDSTVTETFARVVERRSVRQLLLCPPVAAEVGYMARDLRQHTELLRDLSEFAPCATSPTSQDVLDIQHALWSHGLLRAAGAMDTLIAAYARVNGAAVLHYDSDFEHIASAVPGFRHRWIVPRGTAAN
jgi:predicted nucleic acid-binding protein